MPLFYRPPKRWGGFPQTPARGKPKLELRSSDAHTQWGIHKNSLSPSIVSGIVPGAGATVNRMDPDFAHMELTVEPENNYTWLSK